MSEEKIYVGGAKEVSGNFGEFHKLSFNRDDLKTLEANLNEKGWVNVNMNRRKEVSQFGQTHSLVIDTWQPDPSRQQAQQPSNPRQFEPPQSQARQDAQQQAPDFNSDDINGGVDDDCPFNYYEKGLLM